MITVCLQGGLGNQLFQLAFLDYICTLNNTTPFLNEETQDNYHTKLNYFDTIFKYWKYIPTNIRINKTIHEPQSCWKLQIKEKWGIKNELDIQIIGFFQNYKYISYSFISKLNFSSSQHLLSKYPYIETSTFIHIRGGDYHWPYHFKKYGIDIRAYYAKAIEQFPENTKFVIFTNDIPYAQQLLNYEIIQENEVDSLFLMSKCTGGICANSTFSWWGAYLNPNRKLILPAVWTLDNSDSSGFYFPNAIVV